MCTLGQTEVGDRLKEWSDLARSALSVEHIKDGVRLVLATDRGTEARDLAQREASCCSFLRIEVADRNASVEMSITSLNPDGVPVARLLAGVED